MTKMSFARAFGAGQAAICVCTVLLGGVSLWSINRLGQSVAEAYKVQTRKAELVGLMETLSTRIQAAQRGSLLFKYGKNDEQVREMFAIIDRAHKEVKEASAKLRPMLRTDSGRKYLAEIDSLMAQYFERSPAWREMVNSGRLDEAITAQMGTFRPLSDRMITNAAEIAKLNAEIMREKESTSASRSNFSFWLCSAFFLGALGVSGLVVMVVRGVLGRLHELSAELGESAQQVSSASQQVASVSQSLAQGSSEQAASLEETSSSTEEINSMTQKNAENARRAAEQTGEAERSLGETNRRLEEMLASMREINTSSEKISKIIKVIDEIAFQTNILALNAAVEAARAGEAGMGFAVVADEVRNLAQRCAQAARDTAELIEESIRRTAEGKNKLDGVAGAVSQVVDNAGKVKLLANEVSVGSQEQARGIEQISRTVAQMQQLTQASAASAEEGASAGEEMNAQAESLTRSVQQLHALIGGSRGTKYGARAGLAVKKTRAASSSAGLQHLSRNAGGPGPGVRKPVAGVNATAQAAAHAVDPLPLDGDFSDF